jgi:hypothetical protein
VAKAKESDKSEVDQIQDETPVERKIDEGVPGGRYRIGNLYVNSEGVAVEDQETK